MAQAEYIVDLPFGARLILRVDYEGAVALLETLSAQLSNLQTPLNTIAAIMRAAFAKRFAEGGDPQWAALAPSTIAQKSGAGFPQLTKKGNIPKRLVQNGQFSAANILIRTGALRDSYAQKGAKGHVEEIDAKNGTVFVGSSLFYARFHQKGTDAYTIMAKNGKSLAFMGGQGEMIFRKSVQHPGLKARPVLLNDEDVQKMCEVLVDWFNTKESSAYVAA